MTKLTKALHELIRIIEGVLFAASPISIDGIAKYFPEENRPKPDQIREALAHIQAIYEKHGIQLAEVATGYRFQVADDIVPYLVKNQEEKPSRYSRALLETLALIAYRQPITRGEIEDIRGVVVSSQIIKTLDELGWIRIVGYKEVPGKPALFATTKGFLDHFGLKTLEELPPLAELKMIDMIESVEEAVDTQEIAAEIEPVEEIEETGAEIETVVENQIEAVEESEAHEIA